jgi:thiol:disulfide interchange protein DsbD
MKKTFLLFLLFLNVLSFAKAQIFEPVSWNISASNINENNEIEVTFKATMEKGWHIYGTSLPENGPLPTNFIFDLKNAKTIEDQPVVHSKLEKKFEPTFKMKLEWFEEEAVFTQRFKINNKEDYYIKGYVEFMACDNVTCLPPDRADFEIGTTNKEIVEVPVLPLSNIQCPSNQGPFQFESIQKETGGKNSQDLSKGEEVENDYWQPVVEEINSYGTTNPSTEESSLWLIFLRGIFYGLIAIVTPCVWPIIPMTVSFFLKRGNDPKKGKRSALIYGLSIILIYVVLGLLITIIFGASALNSLSTNAIFNILIFALLVLFAISFFGGFDIALPGTWSSKIDQKADKATGLVSILLMAFTLVIVSFSCTGPLIGTLLVHVSMEKSILAPAIGMLGFAVALAGPFTIFAFFPNWLHNLPRSGGWLNSVKVVLGFLEVAFALKFLSVADLAYGWHILDREVFLALWIVIFFLLGVYLLGKIHFRGDDDPARVISVPRFFLAMITFSFVIYLIPGMFGAPLKAVSAFAPPMSTQDFNLQDNHVEALFEDYDEAMEYAARQKKPVILDFTGAGCVNCRKMEVSVWNNPEVKELLTKDYVLVTLWVDSRKHLEEPFTVIENGKERMISTVGEKWSYLQRHKFGANAQPYYVLLDNEGSILNYPFAFSENADEFISFLQQGLENYYDK